MSDAVSSLNAAFDGILRQCDSGEGDGFLLRAVAQTRRPWKGKAAL
jgi:hypothetical protein